MAMPNRAKEMRYDNIGEERSAERGFRAFAFAARRSQFPYLTLFHENSDGTSLSTFCFTFRSRLLFIPNVVDYLVRSVPVDRRKKNCLKLILISGQIFSLLDSNFHIQKCPANLHYFIIF
jgi:hypothetical protein